jgi:hypothetical protein
MGLLKCEVRSKTANTKTLSCDVILVVMLVELKYEVNS